MANEAIPLYSPGANLSATAGAAIIGKRFVDIQGATLNPATGALLTAKPAAAGVKPLGVAAYDAVAGEVFPILGEGVLPVVAGGAITAGDEVEVGADGKAVKLASGKPAGRSLTTAAANADAYIKIYS